jgi:hypothetical protein
MMQFLLFSAFAFAGPELSDRLQITDVVGPSEVKVVHQAGHREEMLRRGANLFVGDEVDVAPKQIIGLTARDDAQYKLAPGTHFLVEARKPDKQTQSYWSFQLLRGAMWGQVAKKNQDGFRLKVRTKSAALGIRGTEYLVSGDETNSAVDVLEGTVWWGKDAAFAAGTYREVSAGRRGELGPDGRIVVTDSKGDKAKLVRDYGLAIDASAEKGTHGTAQQCAALGLGWRTGDGSNGGECFRGENAP